MSADVYPCLRYDDAPAAVRWLVDVLGFVEHEVIVEADGTIGHGELRFGDGWLMLGSKRPDTEYGRAARILGPSEIYLATDEVAKVHQRVVDAGGDIFMPLTDHGYGVGFSVRDPEGNLWSLGDYRPS